MVATKDRDTYVSLAKLAEQAERYTDMLEYVKAAIRVSDAHLSVDERSLLSVAYKNLTSNLRSSWRIVSHFEEYATTKSRAHELRLTRSSKLEIERELISICEDVLRLLSHTLIPAARPGDEVVFYYKMKGDYYRYLAEFTQNAARKENAQASLDSYKLAYKFALATLEATHPTRLGLALNFAVYYRDVLDSPERACHLAKHAFDEAVAVLDQMPEATYRDSLLILQLLRDDLTMWFKEIQERDALEA